MSIFNKLTFCGKIKVIIKYFMAILTELKQRGLINQITNENGLIKALQSEKIKLYCGFDPTAGSLHIGNLLLLITLKRFQLAGYRPIVVLGGATGLIGDPSGKKTERQLNSLTTVRKWEKNIRQQVQKVLGTSTSLVLNNFDWINKQRIINFLRDTGKYFTVPYMLAKESVKSRLEAGISFTEFSYMILQAYDFLHLYQKYNCQLQIGGSDQWGNITSGIDLIKKKLNKEAFGLTVPLVVRSDGKKFGKTEMGTIWLDASQTSPYQFYQFWINASDEDVIKYLKYFTFLSLERIQEIEKENKIHPEKREAQKILAKEVTKIVHGDKIAGMMERISQILFSGKIRDLSRQEIQEILKGMPQHILNDKSSVSVSELLLKFKIVSSKRELREYLNNKAITINGQNNLLERQVLTRKDCLLRHYLFIRKGKKKYYLVVIK